MVKKVAFFPGSFKPPHVGHYTLVKKLLPKVDELYIFISGKPRDGITAEQSLKIWHLYFQSKTDMKKITFQVTEESPILTVYKAIPKLSSKDTIYLIKSSKNASNKRFDMFKRLKYNIIDWTLPSFKTISSTNMREAIKNDDYESFIKFVPPSVDAKKVWKIVRN